MLRVFNKRDNKILLRNSVFLRRMTLLSNKLNQYSDIVEQSCFFNKIAVCQVMVSVLTNTMEERRKGNEREKEREREREWTREREWEGER